jgi:hypothetical protein
MDEQEFRKLVEQLHNELERTERVDEDGQKLLEELVTDIDDLLDRSEDIRLQTHDSIVRRIEIIIDRVEITHPTLTLTLSKIMAILSNAGI